MTTIYVTLTKPADECDLPDDDSCVCEERAEDCDVSVVFVSDSNKDAIEAAKKVDLRRGYIAEVHAKQLNVDNMLSAVTFMRGWWDQKQKKSKKRKMKV